MTPNRGRIARGRETQRILADWLQQNGWPYAEAVYGAAPGKDLLGVPGLNVECKATSDGPITGALAQASKRPGLAVVVWRPDGYGRERVEDWVFAMRVGAGFRTLRSAGYGEPLPGDAA